MSDLILMHGPAFNETGETVERMVTPRDVQAYRNAGYAEGPMPVPVYSDEDGLLLFRPDVEAIVEAIEAIEPEREPEPEKPKRRRR